MLAKNEVFTMRQARPEDGPALRAMQALSMRVLGSAFYAHGQIEAFIAHIGTMDDFLLDEGTYFVVEAQGAIAASGGWSRRTPRYAAAGSCEAMPDLPRIRSVFVHPEWARRGLASELVRVSEAGAAAAGHAAMVLTATMSGLQLYRALGYVETARTELALPGEISLPVVPMRKALAAQAEVLAPANPPGTGRRAAAAR